MLKIFILALFMLVCTLSAAASPVQRIVGGVATPIGMYPFATPLLRTANYRTYAQKCAGTILTKGAVLTAANCIEGDSNTRWRIRVGSNYANSGGEIHDISKFIIHSEYNRQTIENNIAIVKPSDTIILGGGLAEVATIAGANYMLADNEPVMVIGWGATSYNGGKSEILRRVQIWTVNQYTCRSRYTDLFYGLRPVTDSMLCAGWIEVGGRDQCTNDAGGPLLHNNAVVGIASWTFKCGLSRLPGVYTRISSFTGWIALNS